MEDAFLPDLARSRREIALALPADRATLARRPHVSTHARTTAAARRGLPGGQVMTPANNGAHSARPRTRGGDS